MPRPLLLDVPGSSSPGAMWTIALPATLGLIAVYLLLPRPRGYPPWWGASAAALALVSAGLLLIQRGGAIVETILFYLFSCGAVAAGGLLITQRNPVRAALSFALVVLSTCGLFLLQAAPFLMAATIIIYAGAIIVTFLFLIMLARQTGVSDADARSREPFLACVAGFVLLGAILFVLHSSYDTTERDRLLAVTDLALQQSSAQDVERVLGDKREFFEHFREADKVASSDISKRLRTALTDLETEWKDRGGDPDKLKRALATLREAALEARNSKGSLSPPAGIPLSTYSQHGEPGPRQIAQRAATLPRENVANLGRSLFTDYLLAVELGGTLLLVATIGAIAISARRAEGLR